MLHCRTLIASVLLLVVGSAAQADTNQLKTQGPWIYIKRSQDAHITYLATTRATEDPDIFLLIACEAEGTVTASLMHTQGFRYRADAPRIRLQLQLDNAPAVDIGGAFVQARQLSFELQQARDLVPLLFQSKILSASLPEVGGIVHHYQFRLQPGDRALHDIGLYCFHQKT